MITGSIVALATPMKVNGDIDWEALRRLVNFHLDNGTDAIVAAGTTGEPTTMSFAEHQDAYNHFNIQKISPSSPLS